MDHPPLPRRTTLRRSRQKSEIYSTFVVHDSDSDEDSKSLSRRGSHHKDEEDQEADIYATTIYKGGAGATDDEDDDPSLPPLLKQLPKDFGGSHDDDEDDDPDGDFGTMIVKSDRNRTRPSPMRPPRSSFDDRDDFSTFVMRSTVKSGDRESLSGTFVRKGGGDTVSGTFVRKGGSDSVSGTFVRRNSDDYDGTFVRKTSSGYSGASTMERAVASMQAVGELGFGKQRKSNASDKGEESHGRLPTKISSSSIPDYVTREDPTTKYELLNELGKLANDEIC